MKDEMVLFVSMKRLLIALFVFAVVPTTVEARTTTWEFENQRKVEGWTTNNLNIQLIPEGLSISAEQNGQMYRGGGVGHFSDSVSITYASPTGVDGVLFWHMPGQPAKEAYQIPLKLDPTQSLQTIVLDLSRIKEWSPKADSVGIVVNGGAQLLLQRMVFSGPSVMDSVIYPVQSFFQFDNIHAYTINFLWGPMMVYSEEQVEKVYTKIPPLGDSWNEAWYWLIALVVLGAFVIRYFRHVSVVATTLLVVSCIWIINDVRMGSEFIGFALHDVEHWWNRPLESKTYRDRGSFSAFTEILTPLTEGEPAYVLLASQPWPYLGSLRYHTYPSNPLFLNENTDVSTLSDKRIWAVYQRNDITVSDDGRLMLDSSPISPPGKVIVPFEPNSFIFQVDA